MNFTSFFIFLSKISTHQGVFRCCFLLTFLLLYTNICFTQSAGQDFAMNDLHNVHLNVQNLNTYEEQAVLKLKDMLDYLSIIGSGKYNREMRETTLKSVLLNFEAKAELNCNWLIDNAENTSKELKCPAEKLLKDFLKKDYYDFLMNVKDVRILDKLKKLENGNYSGRISFEQGIQIKKSASVRNYKEYNVKSFVMDFMLVRVRKNFGKEVEEVWEVQFKGL
jgi:hypothetical protein